MALTDRIFPRFWKGLFAQNPLGFWRRKVYPANFFPLFRVCGIEIEAADTAYFLPGKVAGQHLIRD